MSKSILLLISEEYGYQSWYGIYHEDHYRNIVARWNTMKGLNCLVPVDFIIPGAMLYGSSRYPVCESTLDQYTIRHAHVHQCDDSYLDNARPVPEADNFEIEGRVYSREEVNAMLDESRKAQREYLETISSECPAAATRAESEIG